MHIPPAEHAGLADEKDSPVLSLLLTIVMPVVILTWGKGRLGLTTQQAFIVALLFPLIYGIVELVRSKRIGFNPIIGVVGVMLTGGIGLLKLNPKWVAIKEGVVPLLFAAAMLISAWMGRPLARVILNQVLDKPRIDAALAERGNADEYERKTGIATYLLAGTFLLSAALNYSLAKAIVKAPAGTDAFNHQLGKMTALSFPIITVPVMLVLMGTLIYIWTTVTKLTGLQLEEVMKQPEKKGKKAETTAAVAEPAVTTEPVLSPEPVLTTEAADSGE